jgi:hypothetical protein
LAISKVAQGARRVSSLQQQNDARDRGDHALRCTTHSQLSTYRRDDSLRTTDTSLSTSSRVL